MGKRTPPRILFPSGGSKYAIRCYCTKCKKGYIIEPAAVIPGDRPNDPPHCYYSSRIDFCEFCGRGAYLHRDCDRKPAPKKKAKR